MRSTWTPRAAWAGAAVVSCVLAPAGIAAEDQSEMSAAISECVTYGQSTYDSGVKFRLESACEVRLSCRISWTLRCGGGRERSEGAAFDLEPGAAHALRASARSCGDEGWAIEDVSWSCRTR